MSNQTKPKDDRLPVNLSRKLSDALSIAATLDGKTKSRFAEDALGPVIEATFKRHGFKPITQA